MNLSSHFARYEFEKGEVIPDNCLPIFRELCGKVLEPIREKYGLVVITSGYRSKAHNASVGGAKGSDHIASSQHCAADWTIPGADLEKVFDWVRLEAKLPIDQIIIEYEDEGQTKPACIHTSYSTIPRYQALSGLTHGRSSYQSHAFNAPLSG